MNVSEIITSRDNSRLVRVRKVRDGREPERIFIEGKRLAEEALRSDLSIQECFVIEGLPFEALAEIPLPATVSVVQVSEKLFPSISDTVNSQGIILIAKRPETLTESLKSKLMTAKLPMVVYLDRVNNPSNLGAIIRTAEAAGIAGIAISPNSADAFSPKAIRAAMGSSFRLPIWENAEFETAVDWAGDVGMITVAADVAGEQDYAQSDWNVPTLLIFGSESHGLSLEQKSRIKRLITIPMENDVESLNLAISAGVVLFEARRQIDSPLIIRG